jgi:hypothetical protein
MWTKEEIEKWVHGEMLHGVIINDDLSIDIPHNQYELDKFGEIIDDVKFKINPNKSIPKINYIYDSYLIVEEATSMDWLPKIMKQCYIIMYDCKLNNLNELDYCEMKNCQIDMERVDCDSICESVDAIILEDGGTTNGYGSTTITRGDLLIYMKSSLYLKIQRNLKLKVIVE